MKKTLPYILMVLMFANMFAPLSVGVSNSYEPILNEKIAEAAGVFQVKVTQSNDSTTIYVLGDYTQDSALKTPIVKLVDASSSSLITSKNLKDTTTINGAHNYAYALTYPVITNTTKYSLQVQIFDGDTVIDKSDVINYVLGGSIIGSYIPANLSAADKAAAAGQSAADLARTGGLAGINATQNNSSTTDIMPACGLGIVSGSIAGCAAQLFYYVLFVPTSFILALTGQFFDFTFAYSVNDKSYRSDFVVQGWGVVRDFCNMFFIFVLLYVAFATILNLHGFKTKETIVNIVIIGLFINFSLFTAQVVIDASNIMARVFYNDKAIVVGDATDPVTGQIIGRPGTNNEIQLSAALVNKIDPQKLILEATQVGNIKDKGGQTNSTDSKNGVTTGTFILVTLLATAINIVGMMVFLSVGMIFVARVIGLWFSMIFAPLAFFTYTVPAMQGWGMVGWRKWWPELLKMAFLAPVFIFFLYLIIKFLNTGLGLIEAGNDSGIGFVLKIVIPFIFIMVLLMKAKDIAKDMSGSLGQSITNGVAAVGGVALGAATGGAAFLGKGTIGRLAANIDKKDWLNDAAAGKTGNRFTQTFAKLGKRATTYTSGASFDARQTGIVANTFSKQTGMNLNNGALGAVGLGTKQSLGGYAGAQKRKKEREDKFGETLGHSHHQGQEIEDEIEGRKAEIGKKEVELSNTKAVSDEARADADKAKAIVREKQAIAAAAEKGSAEEKRALNDVKIAAKTAATYEAKASEARTAYAEVQKEISALKIGDASKGIKGLNAMEKDLERSKTGRQTEYALTVKRKSGKIHDIDMNEATVERLRQDADNEEDPTKRAAKQHKLEHAEKALTQKGNGTDYRDDYGNIKKYGHTTPANVQGFKEAMLEVAQGAAKGAAAGTIIAPGLGTAIGGLAGAIRGIMQHNGATNISVGVKETHAGSHDTKDNYKAPAASVPKHDDHAAPSGGGGAHH